ncbi:putative polygalacturonase, partial [Mucuna pruriens]
MKRLFVVLLIFSFCSRVRPKAYSSFNVLSYGASGDGQTDDSKAFVKAWKDVCNATQETATLVIPKEKTFMLQPVSFMGPCKPSTVNIELRGRIIAPKRVEAWQWGDEDREAWVKFSFINGLVIDGGGLGQVDGQGAAWWQSHPSDSQRPTVCTIYKYIYIYMLNENMDHSPSYTSNYILYM